MARPDLAEGAGVRWPRGSGGGQGQREESAQGLAQYGPAVASARRGGTEPRGVGAGGGGEEQRWWTGGQGRAEE
jgi:hypothetical protein